jgi:hypothetical protein
MCANITIDSQIPANARQVVHDMLSELTDGVDFHTSWDDAYGYWKDAIVQLKTHNDDQLEEILDQLVSHLHDCRVEHMKVAHRIYKIKHQLYNQPDDPSPVYEEGEANN